MTALQEFNTDLLVIVYAEDKTEHTHTLSVSPPHPKQSVTISRRAGHPQGKGQVPVSQSECCTSVHTQYYSNQER